MVDYTVAGVEGGLCAPRGFRAAAVDAGLAPGPGPDLGLVVSQQTSAAAGRFTSHPFASAPVRWSRAQLRSGLARAVLVHAGSANAATGPDGDADAAGLAARCAAAIGCPAGEVLVCGTGAVGVRLAVADAAEAADKATAALGRRGSGEVAKAMTASGGVAREHAVAVAWSEGEVRIGGAAKASVPFAPAFDHPRSRCRPPPWSCSPPTPPSRPGCSTACWAGRWPAPSSGSWSTRPRAWPTRPCFKTEAGGRELEAKLFTLGLWPRFQPLLLPFCNAIRNALGLEEVTDLQP